MKKAIIAILIVILVGAGVGYQLWFKNPGGNLSVVKAKKDSKAARLDPIDAIREE